MKLLWLFICALTYSQMQAGSCDTVCKMSQPKPYFFNGLDFSKGPVGFYWTGSNGVNVVSGQGSDTAVFDFTAASSGLAYICVVAYNDCDTTLRYCFNVYISTCIQNENDSIIRVKGDTAKFYVGKSIVLKPGFTISTQPYLSGPKYNSGSASVNSNGIVTFKPNPNFVGRDTILRIYCTQIGAASHCDTSKFSIISTPPKVINSDIIYVGNSKELNVLPIRNFEGNTLTPIIKSSSGASITMNSVTNKPNYIPKPGFKGIDTVLIIRCDSRSNCDTTIYHIGIIAVDSVDLPNFITPNNDKINDNWLVPAILFLQYPDLKAIIYNKWGSIVWRSIGTYKNDWYGQGINGDPVPDGVYFYVLELKSNFEKVREGFIEVIRQ